MNKNFITCWDGKRYAIDIDAIMKWCLRSKDNPIKECEVTEGYDMEDNIGSKAVRELKSPNTQDDTIRYDLIKLLILPFTIKENIDLETSNGDFNTALMFNTLMNMGFIVEINENENK